MNYQLRLSGVDWRLENVKSRCLEKSIFSVGISVERWFVAA